MKQKLTPKQLAFAQAYAYGIEGKAVNASVAYRHGYDAENMSDAAVWVEACRLLAIPKVALYIDDAQRQVAEMYKVTSASLIREMAEAQELAVSEKQASAAVSAITGKAKLAGLWVEKRESDTTIRHEKTTKPDLAAVLDNPPPDPSTHEQAAQDDTDTVH